MMEKEDAILSKVNTIGLEEVKARHDEAPWVEWLMLNDKMFGTLICQNPGHPNDKHYHNEDEWWIVLEGEIHWEIEGRDGPVRAKAGDFVMVPKRHFHHIHVKGDKPAIRLAMGVAGEKHRHEK